MQEKDQRDSEVSTPASRTLPAKAKRGKPKGSGSASASASKKAKIKKNAVRPASPPADAIQTRDDNRVAPWSLAKTGSVQTLGKVDPPNKDQYFMSLALVASCRSRDPSTQVGACLVNSNKTKVLGIGYNGAPQRIDDETTMPWPDVEGNHKSKNDFVIHAEANALALSDFAQHKNSVMYCTHYPCKECAKTMLHYGVGAIYYIDDSKVHSDKPDYGPAMRLLDYVKEKQGVIVEKLLMDEKCVACFSSKLLSTASVDGVASAINDAT